MEEEKEKKKDIVVLDEGIHSDGPEAPGPRGLCCWFILSPFR
jgi:hypothetical protein